MSYLHNAVRDYGAVQVARRAELKRARADLDDLRLGVRVVAHAEGNAVVKAVEVADYKRVVLVYAPELRSLCIIFGID